MLSFIRKIFLFPVKLYRKFISPLKPPSCRYTPTCSQYMIDAVEEWGVIRGLGLGIWRILRCNPFGRGGYDPVPKRKSRSPEEHDGSKKER